VESKLPVRPLSNLNCAALAVPATARPTASADNLSVGVMKRTRVRCGWDISNSPRQIHEKILVVGRVSGTAHFSSKCTQHIETNLTRKARNMRCFSTRKCGVFHAAAHKLTSQFATKDQPPNLLQRSKVGRLNVEGALPLKCFE
jgi:hypothetical protein